jgi:hypothetical protein
LTVLDDLAGTRLVLHNGQRLARLGGAVQAQHLHRLGGTGGRLLLAVLVHQRADAAPLGPGHHDVAALERAALDQHGADRASALVQLGLDHHALARPVDVRAQIHHLRLEQDALQQVVETQLLRRRHLDDLGFPAQALGHDLVLEQLVDDPRRVGVGLSILLAATMIGAPEALAWLMASIVCGITPSSAATTRMTMSVTLAPRARMALNAAWPGVSRKVTCGRRRSSPDRRRCAG